MDLKLNSNEAAVLKKILETLVLKSRTGELGIIHGADRFISTQMILKKEEIAQLEMLCEKTGASTLNKI